MKGLTLAMLLTVVSVAQADHSVTLGLWTDHFSHDKSYYNERNRLVNYNYHASGNVFSVASFENSHFSQSYMVGAGREWKPYAHLALSASIGVIHGYYGYLPQTTGHLMLAPIFSAQVGPLRATLLGNAVNFGVTYGF